MGANVEDMVGLLLQEQSADSGEDFSTPNTTPTHSRKNRRRSNLFGVSSPSLFTGESADMR